jgi:SAM-dependent methyltransferase
VPTPADPLAAHVAESRLYRRPILAALQRFAAQVPPGATVLDAGAGDAPYRALFGHCDYLTVDWPESQHALATQSDLIADLAHLPLEPATVDAVVCTEVLEHVFDAPRVLSELARVARPGAGFLFTVPFVMWLHEQPHDFARYTPFALHHMLGQAGYMEIDIQPLSGGYSVASEVVQHALRSTILHGGGSRWALAVKWRAMALARQLGDRVAPRLDASDHHRLLPLGWVATATRGQT